MPILSLTGDREVSEQLGSSRTCGNEGVQDAVRDTAGTTSSRPSIQAGKSHGRKITLGRKSAVEFGCLNFDYRKKNPVLQDSAVIW